MSIVVDNVFRSIGGSHSGSAEDGLQRRLDRAGQPKFRGGWPSTGEAQRWQTEAALTVTVRAASRLVAGGSCGPANKPFGHRLSTFPTLAAQASATPFRRIDTHGTRPLASPATPVSADVAESSIRRRASPASKTKQERRPLSPDRMAGSRPRSPAWRPRPSTRGRRQLPPRRPPPGRRPCE